MHQPAHPECVVPRALLPPAWRLPQPLWTGRQAVPLPQAPPAAQSLKTAALTGALALHPPYKAHGVESIAV